jgi:hypothetical protein
VSRSQQKLPVCVPQHRLFSGQHDAPRAAAGFAAGQQYEPESQQKARLSAPTPSPQQFCRAVHRADPVFHRQQWSLLAKGMQCGVMEPAPQHCATLWLQLTPYVVPNTPGQFHTPLDVGSGVAVAGASVGTDAGVGASVGHGVSGTGVGHSVSGTGAAVTGAAVTGAAVGCDAGVGASVTGAAVADAHRMLSRSHASPWLQQKVAFGVRQHTPFSWQHVLVPTEAGSPAAQQKEPSSQQKARLFAPVPSPQHVCRARHDADPTFHRQQWSVLDRLLQCGVSVPAPQHCSVAASQFTPVLVPNGPGQFHAPPFVGSGPAVAGASVGTDAAVEGAGAVDEGAAVEPFLLQR